MNQDDLSINGELLRLGREARGWALSDMATRACMSVKQIRQLEEGGTSAFYSASVKATAVKKVATLLGVSSDDVFGRITAVTEAPADAAHEQQPVASLAVEASAPVALDEAVHVDSTPAVEPQPVVMVQPDEAKSKTSLWVIAGLFVAALAVAAYMQPQDEAPSESAPPLQVVPTDAADAASAAEVPASSVSGSTETVSTPVVQKVAPSTALPASASTALAPAVTAASKAP